MNSKFFLKSAGTFLLILTALIFSFESEANWYSNGCRKEVLVQKEGDSFKLGDTYKLQDSNCISKSTIGLCNAEFNVGTELAHNWLCDFFYNRMDAGSVKGNCSPPTTPDPDNFPNGYRVEDSVVRRNGICKCEIYIDPGESCPNGTKSLEASSSCERKTTNEVCPNGGEPENIADPVSAACSIYGFAEQKNKKYIGKSFSLSVQELNTGNTDLICGKCDPNNLDGHGCDYVLCAYHDYAGDPAYQANSSSDLKSSYQKFSCGKKPSPTCDGGKAATLISGDKYQCGSCEDSVEAITEFSWEMDKTTGKWTPKNINVVDCLKCEGGEAVKPKLVKMTEGDGCNNQNFCRATFKCSENGKEGTYQTTMCPVSSDVTDCSNLDLKECYRNAGKGELESTVGQTKNDYACQDDSKPDNRIQEHKLLKSKVRDIKYNKGDLKRIQSFSKSSKEFKDISHLQRVLNLCNKENVNAKTFTEVLDESFKKKTEKTLESANLGYFSRELSLDALSLNGYTPEVLGEMAKKADFNQENPLAAFKTGIFNPQRKEMIKMMQSEFSEKFPEGCDYEKYRQDLKNGSYSKALFDDNGIVLKDSKMIEERYIESIDEGKSHQKSFASSVNSKAKDLARNLNNPILLSEQNKRAVQQLLTLLTTPMDQWYIDNCIGELSPEKTCEVIDGFKKVNPELSLLELNSSPKGKALAGDKKEGQEFKESLSQIVTSYINMQNIDDPVLEINEQAKNELLKVLEREVLSKSLTESKKAIDLEKKDIKEKKKILSKNKEDYQKECAAKNKDLVSKLKKDLEDAYNDSVKEFADIVKAGQKSCEEKIAEDQKTIDCLTDHFQKVGGVVPEIVSQRVATMGSCKMCTMRLNMKYVDIEKIGTDGLITDAGQSDVYCEQENDTCPDVSSCGGQKRSVDDVWSTITEDVDDSAQAE